MIKIFTPNSWVDYTLLDTGEGEKLERLGEYTFVRPCEDAVWSKTLPKKDWENITGKFLSSKEGVKAGWKLDQKAPKKWEMSYKDIKFYASPTPFRHFGFFPEQASHWEFIENKIKEAKKAQDKPLKFLNLFGYTGVASLFALRAGAEVTHVDASKQTLDYAKENQKLNSHLELEKLPMRVIEDDVIKFLEREIKRGNKYNAIVLDPPKFGWGPKGEIWKIEKDLFKLLSLVYKVLSDKPLFVILTSYATDSSSLALGYALEDVMRPARNASSIADAGGDLSGHIEQGELCLKAESNGRFISLANTAIWSA
ncbi:MAG: class I SAM-dependent methyltransferase [bacterium]|nr:class I SAM-dependent methyltransferase [bacterium]